MEDPWIYLKWKHICEHRLGLIWHPAPSFCFFPNLFLYLSQGPDREPPQFSSCGRFGGPHPSQAEGKHRSVWRLQSWSFSPYEVKETHQHASLSLSYWVHSSTWTLSISSHWFKLRTYPGVCPVAVRNNASLQLCFHSVSINIYILPNQPTFSIN